ncbi:Mss4-like protein, partial [Amanita rubescens]
RSASCLCGAVKFDITGDPVTFMVCHCVNCQKATGSVFMSNTFFKAKNVHITQGQDEISGYEDKATKSGRSFLRSFCSQCGANVLIGNPGGDIIGVPVGVVDDSCDWVPRRELFTHARKPWVKEITTKAK